METFSRDIKQTISNLQNNYCAEPNCYEPIHSLHHQLPNTKGNRENYPLLTNSIFNAFRSGLCYRHHITKAHLYKISNDEARVLETWLSTVERNGYDKGYADGVNFRKDMIDK